MKNVKNIKNKNYDIIDIVFVLDKSGSMGGLEKDTIGGFNAFIERQKEVEGKAYLTLVVFDNKCNIVYDRVDIREISKLTSKEYSVGGCTALYDAIGLAIDREITRLNMLDDKDTPSKVIFNIITDGEENASKEYSLSSIKSKIKELEDDDWQFSFLGANIDSFRDSGKIGVSYASNFSHTNDGIRSVYTCLNSNIANYRANSYAYSVSCANSVSSTAFNEDGDTISTSTTTAPEYVPTFNEIK